MAKSLINTILLSMFLFAETRELFESLSLSQWIYRYVLLVYNTRFFFKKVSTTHETITPYQLNQLKGIFKRWYLKV